MALQWLCTLSNQYTFRFQPWNSSRSSVSAPCIQQRSTICLNEDVTEVNIFRKICSQITVYERHKIRPHAKRLTSFDLDIMDESFDFAGKQSIFFSKRCQNQFFLANISRFRFIEKKLASFWEQIVLSFSDFRAIHNPTYYCDRSTVAQNWATQLMFFTVAVHVGCRYKRLLHANCMCVRVVRNPFHQHQTKTDEHHYILIRNEMIFQMRHRSIFG